MTTDEAEAKAFADAVAAAEAANEALLVLVTGSREWTDPEPIRRELASLPANSILLHGNARGVDRLADQLARELGLDVRPRPADWEVYGRGAGIVRNKQMLAEGPDIVLAFHPNLAEARGTKHMVEIARKAGVPVREVSGT